MSVRRFTRLTNAFSKKWENNWAAVALWFTFYNFCRIHKSLRVTPEMQDGIADHVWSVGELMRAAGKILPTQECPTAAACKAASRGSILGVWTTPTSSASSQESGVA